MSSPNFIIAGERRSGSTSLYHLLKKHPQIGMLDQADFDYFIEPELFSRTPHKSNETRNWDKTHSLDEYESYFKDCSGVIGQKDADLLWWPDAHIRLKEYLPDTKFIIVLRNPVERAASQYYNEWSKGRETMSFKEALHLEEERLTTPWSRLHLVYKARGCYVESLRRFFENIPRERVKVVILEELNANKEKVLADVFEFLNVDVEAGLSIPSIHTNKEAALVRKSFSLKPGLKIIFDLWDRVTEAAVVRIHRHKAGRDRLRNALRGFYYTSMRKKSDLKPTIENSLYEFYKPYILALETELHLNLNCWSKDA